MDPTFLFEKLVETIHPGWKNFFESHQTKLLQTLKNIDWDKNVIFPPQQSVFRVFQMNPTEIKVVLLGQDPYHGDGQATGLSFSVGKNISIPPSLKNIFKELKTEFPERNYTYSHGDLTRWTIEEKIFLLNSALTVKSATPGSHLSLWEWFTDQVIKFISQTNNTCVFLLLGTYAKSKTKFITNEKNRCVCRSHPSPLSANKGGFFDTRLFVEVESKIGYVNWAN